MTENFPPKPDFMQVPGLVSVNSGKELILFDTDDDGRIWKLDTETEVWTQIGTMLVARHSAVVLPVAGLSC